MTIKCRLCGNGTLSSVFSLGKLPLGFPIEPTASDNVWANDLALVICDRCHLIQTEHSVPDDKLSEENLYVSETAGVVMEHDERFVKEISHRLKLAPDTTVLEIGCGDGSLLERFRQNGYLNVIGIEPSLHPEKDYAFPVVESFFNADVVKQLVMNGQQPGFAFANYVIELVPDIATFITDLYNVMINGGYVVLEVPYFIDFVNNFRIDGFAHLRCLWFTITSLVYALQTSGFAVIDVEHDLTYRGGTLRVIAQKSYDGKLPKHVQDWQVHERKVLNNETLEVFRENLQKRRETLRQTVQTLLTNNKTVLGYGAGLKSSTLLNWLGLTKESIRLVVDRDPHKHNRVIPHANIPIYPIHALEEFTQPVAVLILAIDHAHEVEAFLREKLPIGSEIIHLLPEYSCIEV